MSPSAKVRTTSKVVATSPGCQPLRNAYDQAAKAKPRTWKEVEGLFLNGMEGFDENIAVGRAGMGDLQNGKGDFFNDLLALLLENCAQVELYSRSSVPGLIFPKHNLDLTYPSTGTIEFILEAKAVGTPKHPGSPKQKAIGRGGSADLDKRIKEIGFKAIDLKAEFARIAASEGQSPSPMSGDLSTWLRSVKPRSYVFIAARVINDTDRDRLIRLAGVANLVSDAVGVYCYRPIAPEQPTRYTTESVPAHMELGRVLFRACQELAAIRTANQP